MRASRQWMSIAAAILLLPTAAVAQVVDGLVVDGMTGVPIEGVEVALVDTLGERHATRSSDEEGAFSLRAPAPGTYRLEASHLGYDTVRTPTLDVTYAETVEVELRLGVRALAMDPLTVTVRRRDESLRARDLREFYERVERYEDRRIWGILTRREIRSRAAMTASVLIDREFGRRMRCMPSAVDLDGNRVPWDMVTELSTNVLEGVEYWETSKGRFSAEDNCGVLLVWTRPDMYRPFAWGRLLGAVVGGVLLWLVAH